MTKTTKGRRNNKPTNYYCAIPNLTSYLRLITNNHRVEQYVPLVAEL